MNKNCSLYKFLLVIYDLLVRLSFHEPEITMIYLIVHNEYLLILICVGRTLRTMLNNCDEIKYTYHISGNNFVFSLIIFNSDCWSILFIISRKFPSIYKLLIFFQNGCHIYWMPLLIPIDMVYILPFSLLVYKYDELYIKFFSKFYLFIFFW